MQVTCPGGVLELGTLCFLSYRLQRQFGLVAGRQPRHALNGNTWVRVDGVGMLGYQFRSWPVSQFVVVLSSLGVKEFSGEVSLELLHQVGNAILDLLSGESLAGLLFPGTGSSAFFQLPLSCRLDLLQTFYLPVAKALELWGSRLQGDVPIRREHWLFSPEECFKLAVTLKEAHAVLHCLGRTDGMEDAAVASCVFNLLDQPLKQAPFPNGMEAFPFWFDLPNCPEHAHEFFMQVGGPRGEMKNQITESFLYYQSTLSGVADVALFFTPVEEPEQGPFVASDAGDDTIVGAAFELLFKRELGKQDPCLDSSGEPLDERPNLPRIPVPASLVEALNWDISLVDGATFSGVSSGDQSVRSTVLSLGSLLLEPPARSFESLRAAWEKSFEDWYSPRFAPCNSLCQSKVVLSLAGNSERWPNDLAFLLEGIRPDLQDAANFNAKSGDAIGASSLLQSTLLFVTAALLPLEIDSFHGHWRHRLEMLLGLLNKAHSVEHCTYYYHYCMYAARHLTAAMRKGCEPLVVLGFLRVIGLLQHALAVTREGAAIAAKSFSKVSPPGTKRRRIETKGSAPGEEFPLIDGEEAVLECVKRHLEAVSAFTDSLPETKFTKAAPASSPAKGSGPKRSSLGSLEALTPSPSKPSKTGKKRKPAPTAAPVSPVVTLTRDTPALRVPFRVSPKTWEVCLVQELVIAFESVAIVPISHFRALADVLTGPPMPILIRYVVHSSQP